MLPTPHHVFFFMDVHERGLSLSHNSAKMMTKYIDTLALTVTTSYSPIQKKSQPLIWIGHFLMSKFVLLESVPSMPRLAFFFSGGGGGGRKEYVLQWYYRLTVSLPSFLLGRPSGNPTHFPVTRLMSQYHNPSQVTTTRIRDNCV